MIRRALGRVLEAIAWVLWVLVLVDTWAYHEVTGRQLWDGK